MHGDSRTKKVEPVEKVRDGPKYLTGEVSWKGTNNMGLAYVYARRNVRFVLFYVYSTFTYYFCVRRIHVFLPVYQNGSVTASVFSSGRRPDLIEPAGRVGLVAGKTRAWIGEARDGTAPHTGLHANIINRLSRVSPGPLADRLPPPAPSAPLSRRRKFVFSPNCTCRTEIDRNPRIMARHFPVTYRDFFDAGNETVQSPRPRFWAPPGHGLKRSVKQRGERRSSSKVEVVVRGAE